MSRLTVGQKLWYVPSQRGEQREVVVEKVGRKWAAIGNFERIDIETLDVDSGQHSSRGRCYISRDEYERDVALQKAWYELQTLFSRTYRVPEGVTINQIENARRSLFKESK